MILFFFIRKCTPATRPSATLRLRSKASTVVEGGLTADAEGLGFLVEDVCEFRIAQQRLGRDTPDVEAHTTPVLGFDNCGAQAQLGGTNGRDVSTGASSENDDVKVGHDPTLVGGAMVLTGDPSEHVGAVENRGGGHRRQRRRHQCDGQGGYQGTGSRWAVDATRATEPW